MPNLLSAKRCQKRNIAHADLLNVVDDIDTPFTMSELETIINFGQILKIKTVTLIILQDTSQPPPNSKPANWNQMSSPPQAHVPLDPETTHIHLHTLNPHNIQPMNDNDNERNHPPQPWKHNTQRPLSNLAKFSKLKQ